MHKITNTTIALCGSMRFAQEMLVWKKKLEDEGFNVFTPDVQHALRGAYESGSSREALKIKIENNYIKAHYESIKKSLGVLVLNFEKDGTQNYIGGNTLMEMGFGFVMNRDVFLLNPVPDVSYKNEIEAMQPIILNGDVKVILDYYKKLEDVYVSSENNLKLLATSMALREFNLRYNVSGVKAKSNVTEEPSTFEEAYKGAENRLADLKSKIKNKPWKMLVSIESGIVHLHNKHNMWGFSVCIIETKEGKRAVTIDTDIEIPKEMTDLVPSKYPDLGVLVQKMYGAVNKDPYIHITNGKISRYNFMFNSVVNTLADL